MSTFNIKEYLSNHLADNFNEGESTRLAQYIVEDIFKAQVLHDLTDVLKRQLDEIIFRLNKHEPIQYITNIAHFYGREFKVNHHVLIPRPETEELVEWMVIDISGKEEKRVLDLGTGSGCIAITLKMECPRINVSAVDYSKFALDVADENAKTHNIDVHFYKSDFLNEDLWSNLPYVDFLICNPPYVSKNDVEKMDHSVKMYEPEKALFPSGDDHLIFYRKLAKYFSIHTHVKSMYLELNEFNTEEILSFFNAFDCTLKTDLQGLNRMAKIER